MKKTPWLLPLLFIFFLTSCHKEEPPPPPVERTVFVYMPWSSDLLSFFEINLQDLETSIVENRIQTDRFIVFLSETSSKASLFELKYEHGQCVRIPLKSYAGADLPPFTTAAGITSILGDVVSRSVTPHYAMIIGSHGIGWIPVGVSLSRSAETFRPHWESEGGLPTRYFGGKESRYQTDITTLAQGITAAGLHMEYILFDDCYMSNAETAYDLRSVTDYLIGCPTEVMAYGFPYHLIGKHLTGMLDYAGVAEGFYQFYSDYKDPYGTVSVIDCSQLEALVAVMHEVNRLYPNSLSNSQLSSVQRMDGYSPILFYDLGDYVAKLIGDTNPSLLADFRAQLALTVPVKRHTPSFYSRFIGRVPIRDEAAYSGITVSDPSSNSAALTAKTTTAWWAATHD